MTDSLLELLLISKGPLGPRRHADFGTEHGPLGELTSVLRQRNGFFLFNAGIHVFRAGPDGLGPDLESWNDPHGWKHTYGALATDLFCFAQDLFGVQFAISGNQRVVAFDPETATAANLAPPCTHYLGPGSVCGVFAEVDLFLTWRGQRHGRCPLHEVGESCGGCGVARSVGGSSGGEVQALCDANGLVSQAFIKTA
jgi:hypothetical protein